MIYTIEQRQSGKLSDYSLYSNLKKAHAALDLMLSDAVSVAAVRPKYSGLYDRMNRQGCAEYLLRSDITLTVKRTTIN
jgi:hypothetical protein